MKTTVLEFWTLRGMHGGRVFYYFMEEEDTFQYTSEAEAAVDAEDYGLASSPEPVKVRVTIEEVEN